MADEIDVTSDEADALVEVADKPREPTAYEKRLRTENAKVRRRAEESERKASDAEARVAAAEARTKADIERIMAEAKSAAEALHSTAKTEADKRVIRSEIKAAALAAGMRDPSDVKLLDLSAVTLDDNGDVVIPEGFFDSLKASKSYLFADAKDGPATGFTSPTQKAPPASNGAKSAKDMTKEEFAESLKALGIKL